MSRKEFGCSYCRVPTLTSGSSVCLWAPAIYKIVLEGFSEPLDHPDESIVDIAYCEDEMRTQFPEIDPKTVAFAVAYSSPVPSRLTASVLFHATTGFVALFDTALFEPLGIGRHGIFVCSGYAMNSTTAA